MLVAHLVPGYFAAVRSRAPWRPEWSRNQRLALWIAALGSTAAPDLDVMYNVVFRGFFGHTILWTHSLYPYLGLVVIWWVIRQTGRWAYLRTMIELIAIGGFSHLLLDVVAHGTPLLYPVSLQLFGSSSLRELERGLWTYLTDPVFLLEPLLIGLALVHWISYKLKAKPKTKKAALFGLAGVWVGLLTAYLVLFP